MQRISQTFVSLYFGNMNWETELSLPRERSSPQDLFAEFGSHEQVLGSILPSNVKGRGLPLSLLGAGGWGGEAEGIMTVKVSSVVFRENR